MPRPAIAVDRVKIELLIAKTHAENDINVRFSQKSVEVAKAELARSVDSIRRFPKSVSESEMDRLRLLVEKGNLEVEQAEHDFAVAGFAQHVKANELRVCRAEGSRPPDHGADQGHRRANPAAPGRMGQAGRHGAPHLAHRPLAGGRLYQGRYLGKLAKGREVRLTVELPQGGEVQLPGKIVFVDPQIEPVNAQLRVWAEFSNPDLQLLPGMRAKMTIDVP